MDVQKITPKEVENEIFQWISYLNEIVGVLCFSLGLASLGTPNPPFYAFLSFIFVLIFHLPNRRTKAATLNHLAGKKNRSPHENFILGELRGKIKFRKAALLIFGYTFLFLIASLWVLISKWPQVYAFVYGQH